MPAFSTAVLSQHGIRATWRDDKTVVRLESGRILADFWPRRNKWFDITNQVRGIGFDSLLSRLIGKRAELPKTRSLLTPTTAVHRAQPVYQQVRRRNVPDHLFVCQDCYRAFRIGGRPHPSHTACNERLSLRRKEMPPVALSGAVAG